MSQRYFSIFLHKDLSELVSHRLLPRLDSCSPDKEAER